MKKPLKTADRRRIDPRGTVGRSSARHTAGCRPGARKVGMTYRVPSGSGEARDDISLARMPAGIEYRHLPPDGHGYRLLHLCLMVNAVGKIVGSGYGPTPVEAWIEANALCRRSRIRCV